MRFWLFTKRKCVILVIIAQMILLSVFYLRTHHVSLCFDYLKNRILCFDHIHSSTIVKRAADNATYTSERVPPSRQSGVLTSPLYPDREYDISCRQGADKLRTVPLTLNEAKRVLKWYESIDDYFSPNRADPINMPEDDGKNLFENYDYTKPSSHVLEDSTVEYFHFIGRNISCYKYGTVNSKNKTSGNECVCAPGFTGKYCSVPKSVENSIKKLKGKYVFQPRRVPRRIVFAMTFNTEHIVLFLKMIQNAPAVDLFIFLEGNVTNYGDPKPLYLLPALKRGFLRRWHGKIMHMFNSEFVPQARIRGKGFAQEDYIRTLFGPAMKKRITNTRDDDLFMYFDADESPGLDELLFLKLHDGFPAPVGFQMQLFRYGLFWWDSKVPWPAIGVCPMKMFYDVYSGHVKNLRGHINNRRNSLFKNFGKNPLQNVWLIGSGNNFAGWHLSYFGTPGQVYTKIISTINADWPRWADNPVNKNITYIAALFRRGKFFDLRHNFVAQCPLENPQFKDLKYIFQYPKYFNYLLENPTIFVPS
ncbi:beta-1,4-mannosyl-glycoprotein 4-beta-N-acetylglucosaminyltransferase-like [Gigantopelta aegis]|uniref:beta-1,4-mannosyl-glycoprotein 4-beta-N-acetylglucosaminyltransferase-like n=1 Tax=Gigantopelta aegis TaxID=1735272 RepID=UPI001B88E39A|nr:beta-1,4-mannosyl-glycoprotein 4-beta-N-acetylglucosaminyltransferase-like [Gigantopelta aegis]